MEENFQEQEENKMKEEITVKPTNKKMTIFNFALIICIFVILFIYMVLVDRN